MFIQFNLRNVFFRLDNILFSIADDDYNVIQFSTDIA